jgi:hypothetical protein
MRQPFCAPVLFEVLQRSDASVKRVPTRLGHSLIACRASGIMCPGTLTISIIGMNSTLPSGLILRARRKFAGNRSHHA